MAHQWPFLISNKAAGRCRVAHVLCMYHTPICARVCLCVCVHMLACISSSISMDYWHTSAGNWHFSRSTHEACFWYVNKLFQWRLLHALNCFVFCILNAPRGWWTTVIFMSSLSAWKQIFLLYHNDGFSPKSLFLYGTSAWLCNSLYDQGE